VGKKILADQKIPRCDMREKCHNYGVGSYHLGSFRLKRVIFGVLNHKKREGAFERVKKSNLKPQ
jgi:hypothetical protein